MRIPDGDCSDITIHGTSYVVTNIKTDPKNLSRTCKILARRSATASANLSKAMRGHKLVNLEGRS